MTKEQKLQLSKELNQYNTPKLKAHFNLLRERQEALSKRAKYATDRGIEAACSELEARREAVRDAYGNINVFEGEHQVAAHLALLQGQEREILTELELWKSATGKKKAVDAEIEICENILIERGEG